MIWLVSMALADELRAPPPEKVEGAGEGLSFWRAGDDYEGGDPAPPLQSTESSEAAYTKLLERYTDRRADLKHLDVLMADYAPAVAQCALDAGVAVEASASAVVTLSTKSVLSAKAKAGGDVGLAGCLESVLSGVGSLAAIHVGGASGSMPTLNPVYTFRFVGGGPFAVRAPIDQERSFGGVPFGAQPDVMTNRRQLASSPNLAHYANTNDDNIRVMGVPAQVTWSFHAVEGLYAGRVRVEGDSQVFQLREGVKARLGAGKWDGTLNAWYWRGEHTVLVFQKENGTSAEVLTVLDIKRAQAAGLLQFLPGDRMGAAELGGRKLPKVLSDGN